MKTSTANGHVSLPGLVLPALALAVGLALGGCSGGSTPVVPPVASIPAAAASSGGAPATKSPASVAVDARRPQLRVDTSDAEHARLQNIWVDCLQAHGAPTYEKSDGKIAWKFPRGGRDAKPGAWDACAEKRPLGPAAEDPDRNPHYADDFRNWVRCINRKSPVIKVVQTGDGWTYAKEYNADESTDAAFERVVKDCEFEAFGRG